MVYQNSATRFCDPEAEYLRGFVLMPPAGKSVESSKRLQAPAEYLCGELHARRRNHLTILEDRAVSSAPPQGRHGPSARACCPNRYRPEATHAWNPSPRGATS